MGTIYRKYSYKASCDARLASVFLPKTQVDVRGNTRSRDIKSTTALSWGVFPNREVQQPTIFDPETYMVSMFDVVFWIVVVLVVVDDDDGGGGAIVVAWFNVLLRILVLLLVAGGVGVGRGGMSSPPSYITFPAASRARPDSSRLDSRLSPSFSSTPASVLKVWKGEAFRLWVDLWASLYDDESKSAELLHEVHDTYYLVAVVDNNFIDGNLWEVCRCVFVSQRLSFCFRRYPVSSPSPLARRSMIRTPPPHHHQTCADFL